MTTYVDVDTSAEAIQEDEELIEAVNQIVEKTGQVVEKTAEIIYEDVKNDVSGFYLKVRQTVCTTFPFLVYWKEDGTLFWEDMHKLAITSALFVLAFLVLSPSKFWVKKSSSWMSFGNKSSRMQRRASAGNYGPLRRLHRFCSRGESTDTTERPQLHRRRSFSSVDYKVKDFEADDEDEDEESEEERFTKLWPTIVSESRYRSLVLPPQCKRVDKPARKYIIVSTLAEDKKDDKEQGDDENPFDRLVTYWRQFLGFMVSMLRYDYGGAGWTLFYWLESLLRAREKLQKPTAGEDNDDDDESDASSVLDRKQNSASATAMKTAKSSDSIKSRSRTRRKRDSMITKQPVSQEKVVAPNSAGDEGYTNDTIDIPNVAQSSQDEEKKECVDDNDRTTTLLEEKSASSPPSTPTKTTTTQLWTPSERPPRRDSFSSVYNTPANERTIHPITSSNPVSPLQLGGEQAAMTMSHSRSSARKKDALKNYRTAIHRRHLAEEMESQDQNSSIPSTPVTYLPNMRGKMERRESSDGTFYFEAESTDESLRKLAVEIPVPDRNGYILGDDFLEDGESTPLLVFVNSRSGPQQGHLLITQLRGLLNPVQVWDLADGGPEETLESFSVFTRLRILVCGGDGTVSWIISTIEKMKLQRWPPIAILPLGTGNDLARVHGWGGGYSNESLIEILEQVAESYISWLDRWELTIENKKGRAKKVKSFFNYFGVGADAQMALQVHKLREHRPNLFFSRVINKAWYGIFGAEDAIKATSLNLPNDIKLIADGVEVPLPPDSQGIILLNIDSYGGGVPLWARGSKESPSISRSNSIDHPYSMKRSRSLDPTWMRKKSRASRLGDIEPSSMLRDDDSVDDISICLTDEERFAKVTSCERPSSCQDGYLDVVSVRGSFHLGQIRVGLSACQQLCQCRDLKVVIKRRVPVQLDGEPWSQNACTLHVKRKKDAAIMLHRSADDGNGVETEMSKLLDWAEERSYIDNGTHALLMKEFSRRIENKTRERRERSKDGLILSLKRAMESTGNLGNNGQSGIVF